MLEDLAYIKARTKGQSSPGLKAEVISKFIALDPKLKIAITRARQNFDLASAKFHFLSELTEQDLIIKLQSGFLSFYSNYSHAPYVPLAASGPWIVSSHGAVIYDSGSYGMLGFGHAPDFVLEVLAKPYVMANIKTASFSQLNLSELLKKSIGLKRTGGCPYTKFMSLNSGSEAVSASYRIVDHHTSLLTAKGAVKEGKTLRLLSLKHSFHGRTEVPALLSHAEYDFYRMHLASYRNNESLWTVKANDLTALKKVFELADKKGIFIEAFYFEPVQGEGCPGLAVTPEFYALARELTIKHGSLLIADSIQAGLRAQGCLSIVDYPGFEVLAPPDIEIYSKAINAGQFPLSIVALTERAERCYYPGTYGNTMTANPRAMEVAVAVLEYLLSNPEVRTNIIQKGEEFKTKLEALRSRYPKVIKQVQGTGLLIGAEIDKSLASVTKSGGLEDLMRRSGVEVIHGGENALRFTPHFMISSAEIDLIISATEAAILSSQSSAK